MDGIKPSDVAENSKHGQSPSFVARSSGGAKRTQRNGPTLKVTEHRALAATVRAMPEYLSPAWFTEADALLRASETLIAQSQGVEFVLEQRVGEADAATVWHVRFADGVVSMTAGPADSADVVFASDTATAEGIRNGSLSAQAAFIAGDLRVEGSINALLAHAELFAALEDVLGPLR